MGTPTPDELAGLAASLYPLPRSLTGLGNRRTLEAIGEWAPLERAEVPSGTPVYDWVVPPEWNVRSARVTDAAGAVIVDWADNNLHLVGYSEPVDLELTAAELDEHLHSLPERPSLIPYRTAYYDGTWGFCVSDDLRRSLAPDATYRVRIDSTLDERGSLSYGEHLIRGSEGDREIVLSAYICHPSLANDNVAGMVVAAAVARALPRGTLRHDVRLLFAPAGIGALAWLNANESRLDRIAGGLVLACLGDGGPLHYKQTRRGDAAIDHAAAAVLAGRTGSAIRPFVPWGTDERQFGSPGFDLPFGVLTRTPNGLYDEYHTSADDLSLISGEALADSLGALVELLRVLDGSLVLRRVEPRGEPQLSRHGVEGRMTPALLEGRDVSREALLWVMNLADGETDLLAIAERGNLPYAAVTEAAQVLLDAGIVRR